MFVFTVMCFYDAKRGKLVCVVETESYVKGGIKVTGGTMCEGELTKEQRNSVSVVSEYFGVWADEFLEHTLS